LDALSSIFGKDGDRDRHEHCARHRYWRRLLAEANGNPLLTAIGVDPQRQYGGKEVRFGTGMSAFSPPPPQAQHRRGQCDA